MTGRQRVFPSRISNAPTGLATNPKPSPLWGTGIAGGGLAATAAADHGGDRDHGHAVALNRLAEDVTGAQDPADER